MKRSPGSGPAGFVLVVVLWVLAALTLVTLGVSHRAFLERRAAMYAADHVRAMMLARGAVNRGMVELQNKWIHDLTSGTPNMTSLGQSWAQPLNLLAEGSYFELPAEEYSRDRVEYRIRDAESLINLNTAPEDLLENMAGVGSRAARQIVHRRTGTTRPGEEPAPFQEIEEVRYLDGIRDDDWFGEDGEAGLKDLLTTRGDGRINVNTASRDVLLSLPGLGKDAVAQLLAIRAGADGELGTRDDQGFDTVTSIIERGGLRGTDVDAIQRFCKYTSNIFMVQGVATLRAGKVRATVTAVALVNPEYVVIMSWREEPLGT